MMITCEAEFLDFIFRIKLISNCVLSQFISITLPNKLYKLFKFPNFPINPYPFLLTFLYLKFIKSSIKSFSIDKHEI